jgi:hypothetical protein
MNIGIFMNMPAAAIYDVSGRRIPQMQRGVNIVKMSNGKTVKIKKLED